jgi:hypothetical protein
MSFRHNRVRRRVAIGVASVVVTVGVGGCADGTTLRRQQAIELRKVCQTLAARANLPPSKVEQVGKKELKIFYVGPPEPSRRGIDTFPNCV